MGTGRETPKGRGGFSENEKPKIPSEDARELESSAKELGRIITWLKNDAAPLLREIRVSVNKTAAMPAKRKLFQSFNQQGFVIRVNIQNENLNTSFEQHKQSDKVNLASVIDELTAEILQATDTKSAHQDREIKLNIASWVEKIDSARLSINSFLKNYRIEY